MRNLLLSTICLILFLIACEKEKEDVIERYQFNNVQENDVILFTVNGLVESHNYDIESVYNKDFYINHLIDEVIVRNKSTASLYFPQSEFKEALDFIHSDLNVSFLGDSIIFSKNLIVEDFDISVDIRGTQTQNEIWIKGILYEYMFANTGYEGGLEYYPYSVQEIVSKYWSEEYEYSPYDTLALYPFEMVLRKSNP